MDAGKPDRHMRRNAPDWSQKWFVEKQLYPPDKDKLFARLEKRFQDQAAAAAAAPAPVAYSATEMEDEAAPEAAVAEGAEAAAPEAAAEEEESE